MTSPTAEKTPEVPRRSSLWAFAWGLAEATFFFIVPDVFITRVALQDFRRALIACCTALAGSLLGGAILWSVSDLEVGPRLLRSFISLPGISRDLIAQVGQSLSEQGPTALFSGMVRGQPYKLFAVHAGVQEISLPLFLAISAIARLGRFWLTAAVAWLCARSLRGQPPRVLFRLHTLMWVAFYFIYFLAMR